MNEIVINEGSDVVAQPDESIVSAASVWTHLAIANPSEAHSAWLGVMQPGVERAVMRHIGYDPRYGTRTQYLPASNTYLPNDPMIREFDAAQGRVAYDVMNRDRSSVDLALPNVPVRNVASLWEDRMAWGGQAQDDFADATLLAQGTDYMIDWQEVGLSKSGILRRMYMSWPTRARTVKVQYASGYTSDEIMSGIACDLGMAVIVALQYWFSRRGKKPFVTSSESLGGYSVSFAQARAGRLPVECQKLLAPFMSYSRII